MANSKRSLLQSPFFIIGTGILVVTILGLVLLPQLSSTSWFSGKIKQTINQKIPGNLDYTHLSLSWLDGLQINDLVYNDQSSGTRLTIKKVSTSKGLLSLARNYKDGGVVKIEKPQATVYMHQDRADMNTTVEASEVNKEYKKSDANITQNSETKKIEKTDATPLLPPIHVQLNITDGSLVTISPDNSEKTVLDNLNLNLNLDIPNSTVEYQLSFQDGQGAGKLTGEGAVSLPDNQTPNLNALTSNAVLEIQNWQIADMLNIGASQANMPNGEGIINGQLRISGNGKSVIAINGNLKGHGIKLHGGPLKSDTPSITDLALNLNVQKKSETIVIEKLDIQSPFIEGTLAGVTRNQQLKTLTANAKVDAAEIFSQFPSTLNLKKGIKVSEGIIDIKADVSSIGSVTKIDANAHLNRLAGSTGKKKISWKKPVNITLQGKLDTQTPTLDQLTIESSFLQANGSGDSNAIDVQVTADIGTALQELEQFINLDGWASAGKLDIDLKVSNSQKEQRDIKGNMQIANFELSHNATAITPASSFTANLASTVQLNPEMVPREFNKTKINVTSWLGNATVEAERFVPKDQDVPAALTKGIVTGTFNLEPLTTLLHSLKTLPQEQSLSGLLDLSLHVNGEPVHKPTILLSANVSPFNFKNGKQSLSDEKVTVALEAAANLLEQSFTIQDLNLSSSPMVFSANGSMLSKNEEHVVSAKGTTKFDFPSMSELLKSYADIQLEMRGQSEKPFTLEAGTTGGKWVDAPKHAKFSSSLQADYIEGYGLSIESLDIPIRLQESILELNLAAQVNRGAMTVKPKVDLSGSSPLVTLPEKSTILTEVGLTEDMSNDLLAKVHPLFKGVAATDGTISLDMQHLNWPMDKEHSKEATFAGAFTFNDVKLQAGALLTPLLAIMKIDENKIVISDQPMTFVGENERITCSPLEATVNTYSLILEGSVGFDQSLDYIAKIPITEKMVSDDVYEYLEGTFISVPIAGTVSKPSISKSIVQKALGDLVLQAGKKQLGDQAGKLLKKLFQ